MIPFKLIPRNLMAHPIRSILTALSIMLAVFIVCLLQSLVRSLTAGVDAAAANRLIVQSAVSLFVDLPESYQSKIDAVPGVAQTCKLQWFGGIYRDPSNFFSQFGVDQDRLMETYPELEIIAGSEEAFRRDRRGCLIGTGLVERFDFKVGDAIPLIGTIFPTAGGEAWEFQVAGIYRATSPNMDENTMFFHWEYLDESIRAGSALGPGGAGSVGVYTLTVESGADPVQVMSDIDMLFENGPQRVQTTTEKEFQRQFVGMLGNVPALLGSIGGGVVFAILLAVLNTMLMAGRERTRDLGIMKALGFTDLTAFLLLVFESLLLCVVGGVLGVLLAKGSEAGLGTALKVIVPGYTVTNGTLLLALGGALLVGLLASAVPAWRAQRLRPVEAFRAEG